MTTHTTEHTQVEETVKEFDRLFFESEYDKDLKTGSKFCGCYEGDFGDVFDETRKEVLDWLRTTLTTLTTKHQEELEKAVVAERERCIRDVWDCQQEHNIARHGDTPDDAYDRAIAALTPTKTDKTTEV